MTPKLPFLKYFQYMAPENIKKSESNKKLIKLAKALPADNINIEDLADEWKLLQVDEDVNFSSLKKQEKRIDVF